MISVPAAPPFAAPLPVIRSTGLRARYVKITLHTVVDGVTGNGEMIFDRKTGSFLRKFVADPVSVSEGFDGVSAWRSGPDGTSRPMTIPEWRDATTNWAVIMVGAGAIAHVTRLAANRDLVTFPGQKRGLIVQRSETNLTLKVSMPSLDREETTFSDYRTLADGTIAPYAMQSVNANDSWSAQVISYRNLTSFNAQAFAEPAPANDFRLVGKTTVPMHRIFSGGQIAVPVVVNGHRVTFAIDTGGQNILGADVAHRIGIRVVGAGSAVGGGAAFVPIRYARIRSMRIGSAELRNTPFIIVPGANSNDYDGWIGYEVFARLRGVIDYGRNQLTLENRPLTRTRNAEAMQFFDRQPTVVGSIGSLSGLFALDTGAGATTMGVRTPFVHEHHLLAIYKPRMYGPAFDGVGGSENGYFVEVPRVRLGATTIKNVRVTFMDSKNIVFGDSSTAANVGALLLGRFTIGLDYRDRFVVFTPGGDTRLATRTENRLGAWLYSVKGKVYVGDVFRGTPAGDARLHKFQVVAKLNGRPAMAYTQHDLDALVYEKSGRTIELTLSTGLSYKLRLRDLPW